MIDNAGEPGGVDERRLVDLAAGLRSAGGVRPLREVHERARVLRRRRRAGGAGAGAAAALAAVALGQPAQTLLRGPTVVEPGTAPPAGVTPVPTPALTASRVPTTGPTAGPTLVPTPGFTATADATPEPARTASATPRATSGTPVATPPLTPTP